ncbi:MAG: NAD(P)H-flavin reductase [Corallincola sp.]|nr:NAD(P)H-flavin reductase [Corallincola sp.]
MTSSLVSASVTSIQPLTETVFRVELQLDEAVPFAAGQYLQICLTNQMRRPFSIACAPGSQRLELHIGASARDSKAMEVIHYLQVHPRLTLELPLGNAYLRDSERPLLLLVGGTGFAYAKSIIEQALVHQPQRQVILYWGGRHRDALYLNDLAESWARNHPQFRYQPVLDEAPQGWHGLGGRVHEALIRHEPQLAGCDIYVAGPFDMAAAARTALFAAGLPASQLFGDAYAFI